MIGFNAKKSICVFILTFVALLTVGCASTNSDSGGFPFYGKRTQAPPPPTGTIGQPMIIAPPAQPQDIQVMQGPGPNAPPASETIGYTPPQSSSSPNSSYPTSTYSTPSPSPYSSGTGISSSSGTTSTSPYSGNSSYPETSPYPGTPSSGIVSPGTTSPGTTTAPSGGYSTPPINGNGYGPTTQNPVPAATNTHYVNRYPGSIVAPSSMSGNQETAQNSYPSMGGYSETFEIPLTQSISTTAAKKTTDLGGQLSAQVSCVPGSLSQGVVTTVAYESVSIIPEIKISETQAANIPPMPGEPSLNTNTENQETYVSREPDIWDVMAKQDVNLIFSNEKQAAYQNQQLRTEPLTDQDYQMVVQGQIPKSSDGVLVGRATAFISGLR